MPIAQCSSLYNSDEKTTDSRKCPLSLSETDLRRNTIVQTLHYCFCTAYMVFDSTNSVFILSNSAPKIYNCFPLKRVTSNCNLRQCSFVYSSRTVEADEFEFFGDNRNPNSVALTTIKFSMSCRLLTDNVKRIWSSAYSSVEMWRWTSLITSNASPADIRKCHGENTRRSRATLSYTTHQIEF